MTDLVSAEIEKYDEIWTTDDYRKHSPGLQHVPHFLRVVKPEKNSLLIDVGCGAGVAGLEFEKNGLRVNYLDITDSALDPDVNKDNFIKSPIWGNWKDASYWDYGYCCDVMEHIHPEFVMLALDKIIDNCKLTWFTISNKPDSLGALIGKPLHLTVQPYLWWLERLELIGTVEDARDLCGQSFFLVSR